MKNRSLYTHPLVLGGVLWIVLVAVALWMRPLLTTIETRVMTVAWEMHVRNNFLVPTLNFVPYTQKPPLLAWLINAGWAVFGFQDWVGTVVASLFSFGCIVMTGVLADTFWPGEEVRKRRAMWIAFGGILLQLYGTIIFYDFMLTFFVLVGLYAIWNAAHHRRTRDWLLFGCAIGLGALSKGPVILVHLVPVALLAPLWAPQQMTQRGRWYGGVGVAILIGAAIALSWAIPAALGGGSQYAKWIFLGQTTKRVANAFNHKQPWWFYFTLAPLLALPWLLMPSVWQNLRSLRTTVPGNPGLRFIVCWILSTFIMFTMFSGKQIAYILPLCFAAALMIASVMPAVMKRWDAVLVFGVCLVIGMALIALYCVPALQAKPILQDITRASILWSIAYCAAIIVLGIGSYKSHHIIPGVAIAMWGIMILLHVMAAPAVFDRFSTERIAQAMVDEKPGSAIGMVSIRYQGDVNYLMRVTEPLTILLPGRTDQINAFFAKHPDGRVLTQVKDESELEGLTVVKQYPARSKRIYAILAPSP